MASVHRFGRVLLIVVALLATMHGLLHTHAINADPAGSAAQNCVLCVSAQSSVAAAPAHVAPPATYTATFVVPDTVLPARVAGQCLPSRAPPLG